jgi:hypothetical protein
MADTTLNITRDARQGGAGEARNEFTRSVEERGRIGRSGIMPGRSRRLYGYDRDQGAAGATLKGSSDKADRLPVEEAARLLAVIHTQFGVSRQMEGFLYDFDHQMYICYTLNGGSQFTPSERVKFYVGELTDGGFPNSFAFSTVHSILGADFRRFFRTMANDVVMSCKQVIEHCDFEDPEMVEQRQQLMMLAQSRDIARYPYLCADCADAATNISTNEYHAILKSKATVIAGTANSVDKRSSAFPIRSADNFDSSVGASTPAAYDVHGRSYHD